MASKLAMFSVVSAHVGPWIIADGSEHSIQVIGSGCDVAFECVHETTVEVHELKPASTHQFPENVKRYRAIQRTPGTIPTTVKVLFS